MMNPAELEAKTEARVTHAINTARARLECVKRLEALTQAATEARLALDSREERDRYNEAVGTML